MALYCRKNGPRVQFEFVSGGMSRHRCAWVFDGIETGNITISSPPSADKFVTLRARQRLRVITALYLWNDYRRC